jgi:aryl-alcohol dehydrogenase-like predicted oxidoreductase
MKRRALGNSGIMVSEIGLGACQLTGGAWGAPAPGVSAPATPEYPDKPAPAPGFPDTSEALRIVAAALDAGCDFFDTAPGYGRGRSEEILGEALAPVRGRVTICTKFGHDADGASNFAPPALGPGLEGSLRRLRTDYVDVLLLHNPARALMDGQRGGAALFAELERLKTQGKVRVYGVSLDGKRELETVLQTTRCGAVEVLYNAFHQEPGGAFAAAAAKGVGLIVKVPLDSGWLSGKYRSDSRFTDVRQRWSPQVIARRAQLVEELARWVPAGMTMGQAALKYVLARPEVSTVIPGAKSVPQVRDNLAAGGEGLPAAALAGIRSLWERELQDNPLPW